MTDQTPTRTCVELGALCPPLHEQLGVFGVTETEAKASTRHKRCADCGRFVDKKRWTPPTDLTVCPLCHRCAAEYDPPEW